MQTSTCVVCQTRVSLTTHKLVSVQWIDTRSGALLTLHFHSDCYMRWYLQAAEKQQAAQGAAGLKPDAAGATGGQAAGATRTAVPALSPPAGAGTAGAPPAGAQPAEAAGETQAELERVLSANEIERLRRLRGRRDTDPVVLPGGDRGTSEATGGAANRGEGEAQATEGSADGAGGSDAAGDAGGDEAGSLGVD